MTQARALRAHSRAHGRPTHRTGNTTVGSYGVSGFTGIRSPSGVMPTQAQREAPYAAIHTAREWEEVSELDNSTRVAALYRLYRKQRTSMPPW